MNDGLFLCCSVDTNDIGFCFICQLFGFFSLAHFMTNFAFKIPDFMLEVVLHTIEVVKEKYAESQHTKAKRRGYDVGRNGHVSLFERTCHSEQSKKSGKDKDGSHSVEDSHDGECAFQFFQLFFHGTVVLSVVRKVVMYFYICTPEMTRFCVS